MTQTKRAFSNSPSMGRHNVAQPYVQPGRHKSAPPVNFTLCLQRQRMQSFELAGTILFSIGSAGAILFALSSWLGKVWANRILERERNELSILKETSLKEHNEKTATYKTAVDVVAKILADLDKWTHGDLPPDKGKDAYHSFNEQRMRVYGYLAMVAPQAAMDAQDALMDKVLLVAQGKEKYIWAEIRELALALLNEIRKDIAVDKSSISYNGKL